MTDKTFKMETLVGESSDGIEAAVRQAVGTSADVVEGHSWVHVTDIRANLDGDGGVDRWQVTVDVAFEVQPDV